MSNRPKNYKRGVPRKVSDEDKALARLQYEEAVERHNEGIKEQYRQFDEDGLAEAYLEQLECSALKPQQELFLKALLIHGVTTIACRLSHTAIRTVYDWRKDTDFEVLFQEALKIATDRLELEAIRLATGHYKEPIASMGKIVGYKDIRDTKVLMALLRSRDPIKFGTKVDVTSNGQSLVKIVDKDAWDSL